MYHNDKKDGVRVESLRVVRGYLELLDRQLLSGIKGINEKLTLLIKTDFLPELSQHLIKHLTDYFDAVREQA